MKLFFTEENSNHWCGNAGGGLTENLDLDAFISIEKANTLVQSLLEENERLKKLAGYMAQTKKGLKEHIAKLENALAEISLYGFTRPMEIGEGDDGDGHFKRIAFSLVRIAAMARAVLGDEK